MAKTFTVLYFSRVFSITQSYTISTEDDPTPRLGFTGRIVWQCQSSESPVPKQFEEDVVADKATTKTVADEATAEIVAEEATEEVMQENQSEKPEAAQVSEFECFLCDFKSKWKNGLAVHMAKIHSQLEQLDGHVEIETDEKLCDEKYLNTKHYWAKGYLGGGYQIIRPILMLWNKWTTLILLRERRIKRRQES